VPKDKSLYPYLKSFKDRLKKVEHARKKRKNKERRKQTDTVRRKATSSSPS